MKIKDHINIQSKVQQVPPIDKICFGFSHITTNNRYNFSKIDAREKVVAYDSLIEKLTELSKIDMSEAHQRGKKLGAERIPYSQLLEPFKQICDNSGIVTRDSKVVVFQFCNHGYRLICKDDLNHSNLLHIIGIDFDFSAYNHGK